ncbi:hypothetical protein ETH_00042910, partial [Eimeria tenella]
GGAAAAGAAAAAPNAESQLPPEELLFSPSSPLRCVKVHFPFEEFRRAGGTGRGAVEPLSGLDSLHPQKGLFIFKALLLRGLERPVVRLTHEERRSYRYIALHAIDTANTPWTGPSKTGPEGASRGPLSEEYLQQLAMAGVRLVPPYPDPERGPLGNCWLLRGLRIRQGCRWLTRADPGAAAGRSAAPQEQQTAYVPQCARLCPWTEPVFLQLTWLAPAFFQLEVAAGHFELKARLLQQTELRSPQGPLRLGA